MSLRVLLGKVEDQNVVNIMANYREECEQDREVTRQATVQLTHKA